MHDAIVWNWKTVIFAKIEMCVIDYNLPLILNRLLYIQSKSSQRFEVSKLIENFSFAVGTERNGINQRLAHSTPSSPQGGRPNSFEVIGSAESLVGRVSVKVAKGSSVN